LEDDLEEDLEDFLVQVVVDKKSLSCPLEISLIFSTELFDLCLGI
jgi:hypothetical protein